MSPKLSILNDSILTLFVNSTNCRRVEQRFVAQVFNKMLVSSL
jgi:hypothetical protein